METVTKYKLMLQKIFETSYKEVKSSCTGSHYIVPSGTKSPIKYIKLNMKIVTIKKIVKQLTNIIV